MGTNYYLRFPEPPKCPHCGRHDAARQLHIGKQSAGWRFSFHGILEEGLNCKAAWESYIEDSVKIGAKIVDESEKELTPDEFWKKIRPLDGKSHALMYPDGNWVDQVGCSFSDGEFS